MAGTSRLKLSDFDISEEFGFLVENPWERLPKHFDSWNEAAEKMADLYVSRLFQDHVKQMPVLDWRLLKGKREKLLAHLQLSLIASGYVWQNGPDNAPKVLPRCVAVPLWNISQDLEIQPMLSHPGFILSNWKLKDPSKPFSLSNLQCLYHLPGGDDCENLVLVNATIEEQFKQGVLCIVEGANAVDTDNYGGLTSALEGIQDVLLAINQTFTNIHSLIRPDVFFQYLVPFVQGWGKEGTPLSDGLVYSGVSEAPIKTRTYAASQTSIAQSLDAFLDISHETGSNESLLEIRTYMTKDHRRFIEVLEARPSTREFVSRSGQEELKKAYNDCTNALTDFRNYHIKAVTKYIVVMANKARKESGHKPTDGKETDEAKLISFLKCVRTETTEKLFPERKNNSC